MQTHAAADEAIATRPLYLDILLALAIGFIATAAKRYLDFHLGIPGHAGVGWIATLVLGRIINPRFGMATLAGLSMGVWAIPLGLGHTFGYNALLYGSAAALLDTPLVGRLPLHKAWGAGVAGIAVHLGKFAFVFARTWLSGILRRVAVFGFAAALGNHIFFGAAGGVLGWVLWRSGRSVAGYLRQTAGRS